ncbi:MAG: hypothetical protein R3344_14380, partial [Acidobacteriota bacterium]|nr:hypothetical protein [Acidobacteriota bacterium]
GHADYIKNMSAAATGGDVGWWIDDAVIETTAASPRFPWFPLNVGGDGEDIGGPPAPVGGDGEDIGAPAAPDGGLDSEHDVKKITTKIHSLGAATFPIPIPFPFDFPLPLNVGGDGEDIGDNPQPPGIEHEDIG